jgi:hypothetical protein
MIAVLLAGIVLAQTAPAATPACHEGDISVIDLRAKTIKGSARAGLDDRLLLTADFSNVGAKAQLPHTRQHAELVRDGKVVATQPLPALAASVVYPLQFRIFRDTATDTGPVTVTVRYVLDQARRPSRNNCSPTNDSLQKTF